MYARAVAGVAASKLLLPQGKQRAAADLPAMNESMPEKFKRGPVSREASASGVCGTESGVVRGGDFEMGYSQSKPAHPPHGPHPSPSPLSYTL